MKTQNIVKAVCPELVVVKVECILKYTRPDIFKNKKGNFDQYAYKELSKEIGLIIDSLYEKDLIPNYKLLDLIKYAKRTDNIFAKVIVEIDYLNEIATMDSLEEIKIIKDFAGYYGDAYTRCNKKIDDIYREKFVNAKSVLKIESIMADCPWQTKSYDFGISMLLPHYKIKVDKLTSAIEIYNYLNRIRHDRKISLGYSKKGNEFLRYCNKLTYKFDIEQSDTKDEVLKIRDKIFNSYKDLVVICDEKLADITAKETDDDNPTNDKIMETFKYLTESYKRYNLLIKYLSEDRDTSDTSFYWFIYQELLTNFEECNEDIAKAKSKLIQAFHVRTSQDKSFQTVYDIFYEPSESNTDCVSQNLANDETVQTVAIDRIKIATINELLKSIVTFCYSRNYNLYDAFIERFFALKPTIDEIVSYEYEFLSVKSFIPNHAKLLELFYANTTCAIKELIEADEIIMSEIHKYFIIANKPGNNEAKKLLIQFIGSTN